MSDKTFCQLERDFRKLTYLVLGTNKFKHLEKLTNPQREELLEEYNRVSKKVT